MHLQRQGDEHSGSVNRGASSLKKRSPSAAGHALGPPTTLTACHGCLMRPGSFVFVTICRGSAGIRQRQVVYNPRNAFTARPSENEREETFLIPSTLTVDCSCCCLLSSRRTLAKVFRKSVST